MDGLVINSLLASGFSIDVQEIIGVELLDRAVPLSSPEYTGNGADRHAGGIDDRPVRTSSRLTPPVERSHHRVGAHNFTARRSFGHLFIKVGSVGGSADVGNSLPPDAMPIAIGPGWGD